MVKPTTLSQTTSNGEVKTITGVLVLGKPDKAFIGKTPTYVTCIANLENTTFESLANKSLRSLSEYPIEKTVIDGKFDWSTFVMSTSVYAIEAEFAGDATGKKLRKSMASLIKEDNLKTTTTEAEANPVNIYIERLAAKIRVNGLGTYPSLKSDGKTIESYPIIKSVDAENGTISEPENTTLAVELTGWQICNRYAKCNIYKNINSNADYFPNWNDPTRHRCYWAETPTDGQYYSTTYDIYDESGAQFKFGNYNGSDLPEIDKVIYTYPLTGINPESMNDRKTNATAIVVKGYVRTETEVNGAKQYGDIDLVFWSGHYYTSDAFKNLVAYTYNQTLSTGGTKITKDNVHLVSDGKNKNTYKVEIRVGELKPTYNAFTDISYWNGGVTSFYINIQHAEDKDGNPIYGIVRNHIYDHTISAVIGLGLPGNDQVDPSKDKESYLSCAVNVINWRLISKDVVLQ